jgi:hypothetical protein
MMQLKGEFENRHARQPGQGSSGQFIPFAEPLKTAMLATMFAG